MDNASLQNLLKRLCKVMWEANVTNPITYVTQISYLLFLKMLEEMDAEQADNPRNGGGKRQRGDAKRSLRVEKGDKYVLFLAHALRSLRPGGRAGIVFPNGILFGDSNSHLEVKKRLLAEGDLQAVVTLPKGMFEPYTPNPTCFLIFQKTDRPTKETWFYRVQGDGSSLKKARKFGPQFPIWKSSRKCGN